MMITKKIGIKDGIGYILFQIIGAVVATASLVVLFPDLGKQVFWGAHGGPSELLNNNLMSGLAVEIILTFFLVTVIFMTAVHKKAPKSVYGAAIGGMVFLLHLVGVPLTGASMNPARSFSPTLFSGDAGLWEVQWLYWVGPIVGGIIAGVVMNYIYVNKAEKEE
jgi:glycerol uptake facilitator-like aquaporin